MKRFFLPLAAALALTGAVSCSDDDTIPADPEGTVALNMLDEQNGKTLLGNSGVYIDKAQNFVAGGNCVLFVLGESGGLGAVVPGSFDTPADKAAVQAGCGYVAVRPQALRMFASGKQALQIGISEVNYMKFYVVSSLTEGGKTIGAAVRYALAQPAGNGLPENGSTALTIDLQNYTMLGQEVVLPLPTADFEYEFSDSEDVVKCRKEGNKLVFWLEAWYNTRCELVLRIGGSYTKVYVEVV